MRRLYEKRRRRHDLTRLTITALGHVERHPGGLQPSSDGMGGHAFDGRDGGLADGGDRRQTGTRRLPVEMDGASAAEPGAAAELAALQIQFVAQHPKQGHIAVDIDGPLQTVHLDRIGHRPRL